MLIERYELSVEDGPVLDGSECLADRGILARDIVEVARIERGVTGLRHRDRAEAVPFRLEYPIGIVERLVGERGEHRAKIGSHHDHRLSCQPAVAWGRPTYHGPTRQTNYEPPAWTGRASQPKTRRASASLKK